MRIPITINGREEPLRRKPEPFGLHARPRDEYGTPRTRTRRGFPDHLTRNRTNLAVDYRTDEDEESNDTATECREALQEEAVRAQQ
jgi:hypothetical protein